MKGECRATVVFSAKELTLGIFFKGPSKIADFKLSAATTISAQTLVDFNGLGRVGDQFLTTFNRLWNVQGLGAYVTELWDQYCDLTLMFVIDYKQWALGGLVNEVETCDMPEDPGCNTGTSSKDHTSYFSTAQGDYDGLNCGLIKKFTVA
ncbi:hypothetical protein Aduo_018273 [Ancylostoma duodenale]